MIINTLQDFKNSIKKSTRILGVDFGTKNIGLAISDRDWNIATPKVIIKRLTNKSTINTINNLIKENNISAIVFGLPLNSNGDETQCCATIKRFVAEFEKVVNLPIFFSNEAYTSFITENTMIHTLGQSFKTTKANVDKIAASHILQNVLDEMKNI